MKDISNSSQRRVGVVLSYVQIALSIVLSLSYTPIMIRWMGKSEYGLYGTVFTLVSFLSLLDLGFTSSYVRFYTKYKVKNEYDKIDAFNSLFFTVFSILAVIAFAIGLFFSFHLELIFGSGLTETEYMKARIMVILLTISSSLGFLSNVFGCFISVHQKFIFTKTYEFCATIIATAFNLIVLKLNYGAVGLIVVSFVFGIIKKIVYISYAYKGLKFKFNFGNMEKGVFKQVFSFSGLIAINLIVDKINAGIDSVLLGRFCGTAVVAIYSVASSLHANFVGFSLAISDVFTPHVHKLVNSYEMDSKEQRTALTLFFTKVGRLQYLLLALIASGIIFFGKPFIEFWSGGGYERSYYVALLLILPGVVPLIQNVGIEIQRAENRHHYRSIIYGLMAIANFIISIILCQIWDAVGCALGTCIAVVVANIIIMNIIYHKKINIDMIYFWKNILRQTVGMIIPFICGILIMKFYEINSIIKLVAGIAAYSLIYCVFVWFFSMNNYEKNIIKGAISKIFKKAKV